ncbi:type II secretion system protein M [Sphingomonas sp. DT-204]|uniref:type II secretion system protein M n=1 Tax=Sphingomonas sp. DT-204 TaxID=3396166 RepID=UPI003F1C14CB
MTALRLAESPIAARLAGWWAGLSRRERIMVGGLGIVLALLVLIYGVVKPLQAARAQALADIRTYDTLKARIRAAGALNSNPGPPPRIGPPANVVTASANSFNLTAQIEPMPGGVRATVAEGGYDAVMNWLADIARTSNLSVTRVDIRKRPAPGMVSATVEFRG